jgi:mono/diheme cytochrome c family protein
MKPIATAWSVFFVIASSATLAAQAAPAAGQKIFEAQKCSLCHSVAGKGNAKGALDGAGSKLKAEEIRQWLTDPQGMATKHNATRKPPMKSFASLPAADLDALVAYVASLKK